MILVQKNTEISKNHCSAMICADSTNENDWCRIIKFLATN